jgi:hypothetical protein
MKKKVSRMWFCLQCWKGYPLDDFDEKSTRVCGLCGNEILIWMVATKGGKREKKSPHD